MGISLKKAVSYSNPYTATYDWLQGGEPDGGTPNADRQQQLERDKAIAIDTINRLFGVESARGAPELPEKPRPEDYPSVEKTGSRRLGVVPGVSRYESDLAAWEKLKAQHDAYINKYKDETATNKQAREDLYGGVRTDLLDYLTSDLTEQKTDADRSSKFWLAQRGVTGGSSDIDTRADILGKFNKAVIDVDNRADSAVDNFRGSDESARLDIIDLINSGTSLQGAQERASNALSQNLTDAKQNALYDGLGSVFTGYAAYKRRQNSNNNGGGGGYGSTYYGNNDAYSGR